MMIEIIGMIMMETKEIMEIKENLIKIVKLSVDTRTNVKRHYYFS